MKRHLLFLILAFMLLPVVGQEIMNIKKAKPQEALSNILVRKIADADEQTAFLIWIKADVPLHKHEWHTENIYVLEGKGEMQINDEKFVIRKGDFFSIPKNTPHGLKVLSAKPVKVLSIQAPRFKGDDRIFIKN